MNVRTLKQANTGITLIALVVTIVILLILAGITINLVFSDNGIIKKAQEAANKMNEAITDELTQMNELSDYMGNMLNILGGEIRPEEIGDITTLTEIQTANAKGKDTYENVVTVPKGFKVVISEATTVPEGIVIEDASGNQFVWIPVGTVHKDNNPANDVTVQLGRYTFDTTTGEPTPVQLAYIGDVPNYVNTDGTVGIINTYYSELSIYREGIPSDELNGENATAKNLAEFIESVKINKGYYLARYEASYGSGYNSEGTTDTEKYENAKPLSKQSIYKDTNSMNYTEGTLWNFITQLNASKVCKNMYNNNQSVGVESDLVNSYAWDTAIVFIQEMKGENENYANKRDANGELKDTGIEDKICNIFNISSNLAEWSTEYSTNNIDSTHIRPCTARGGGYNYEAGYTAYRDCNYANNSYDSCLGFRLVIYLR